MATSTTARAAVARVREQRQNPAYLQPPNVSPIAGWMTFAIVADRHLCHGAHETLGGERLTA